MTEFKVPELGENVEAADVARVLVNVGDTIKKDQPVLELETDKATIEVPSSVAGVIKEIKVKKGEKIQVGAVILTVDDAAGNGARASGRQPPAVAGGRRTGARSTRRSRRPRRHRRLRPPLRQRARRSQGHLDAAAPLGRRGTPGAAEGRSGARDPRSSAPAVTAPLRCRSASAGPAAPAAPSVRRLAREIGVDINQVQGSGPGGRISLDDVKEHARRILSSVGAAGASAPAAAARRRARFPISRSGARSSASRGATSGASRRSISATRGTPFRT